ncbi:hypothetical protein MTX26_29530 [Bradyrhizobium sp. ISRA443]|uniref:hypothetical protein n=1 Tax=unclassified Bradyrhizobium TaxID=2631580 RepID=UPI00247A6775|nr:MULTISPECIES: hypothetical protein [unclassified Bradyrhizobium]WGR93761.1 hypothetical protein MTX20_04480 [Bradyrhizobium sp. ISRA435]WGR98354.1 hypothetical protein MTX23_29520 [Bradyrhizobium sp. ISRA436]WGS05242.1 hypothetical protein MTX18_29535 [Bradyrhizobium sp. ISRA437]WGS12128.1 hypothetical protein MTX26_29530 [Bradyrhizobium sp. ISRA443]
MGVIGTWSSLRPLFEQMAACDAKLGQIMSRERERMTHKMCHKLDVVLAKARTHYPKCQLSRDAGAKIAFITKYGAYGFWLSPGRHWRVQRAKRP